MQLMAMTEATATQVHRWGKEMQELPQPTAEAWASPVLPITHKV